MSRTNATDFDQYRVDDPDAFSLDRCDSRDTAGLRRKEAGKLLRRDQSRLGELQELLYASGSRALLVVFQAMDTGGKDGTIRSVLGPLNPQGVRVANFKVPTPIEKAHDFLWRIHRETPPLGMIGVFNRSHYESVLVEKLHGLAPADEIEERYAIINEFERGLVLGGTSILKFFLHISRAEQAKRLRKRITDPSKHWKFSRDDLAERERWAEYMDAYELAIKRCSTPHAPWHVVPADRKWYRDVVVCNVIRSTLEEMDLRYPESAMDPAGVEVPD